MIEKNRKKKHNGKGKEKEDDEKIYKYPIASQSR